MKYLVYILLFTLFIGSCGKYEEGPKVSFRSRAKRITGLWKVDKFSANDIDSTTFYTTLFGSKIDIKDNNWEQPDGDGIMNFRGSWNWHTLKYYTEFHLDYLDSSSVEFTDTIIQGLGPFYLTKAIKWEIMRITKKELFLETEHSGLTYRLEMSLDKDYK